MLIPCRNSCFHLSCRIARVSTARCMSLRWSTNPCPTPELVCRKAPPSLAPQTPATYESNLPATSVHLSRHLVGIRLAHQPVLKQDIRCQRRKLASYTCVIKPAIEDESAVICASWSRTSHLATQVMKKTIGPSLPRAL